jgi:rhodanese/phosphatase family protein
MNINSEQVSKKLNGVKCELEHGHPLHFVLNVEKHGMLGAARLPDAEMDWKGMSSIGFRWVICACSKDTGSDPFPLKFLARIGLTNLSGGGQPDNTGAEFKYIEATTLKAFSRLSEGGILVHCVGGRGRTGTIIGAILRHCGYGATEVIDFLDAAYRGAGRPCWPESPWQSQVIEQVKPSGQEHLGSRARP